MFPIPRPQPKEQDVKTIHRSYNEAAGDFNLLCHFMIQESKTLRALSTWCLVRFVDWKWGLYDNVLAVPDFWERNAQLWFDGFGDLAGLAISETGSGDFAILTTEGYRFLFGEMLAWVLETWGSERSPLSIEITERATAEVSALERAGFQQRSISLTRRFDLTTEPAARYTLEPGFSIVDMFTHPDYRAQRIMRAEGFGGQSDLSEKELRRQLQFYNHSHQGPIYHPQTDLCVMAEDGTMVSGCEALIDAHNMEADIERVCTHSAFRRRGFARAVIQECLIRLHRMGMRTAYITGYGPEAIALYGSLGHVEQSRGIAYQK